MIIKNNITCTCKVYCILLQVWACHILHTTGKVLAHALCTVCMLTYCNMYTVHLRVVDSNRTLLTYTQERYHPPQKSIILLSGGIRFVKQ